MRCYPIMFMSGSIIVGCGVSRTLSLGLGSFYVFFVYLGILHNFIELTDSSVLAEFSVVLCDYDLGPLRYVDLSIRMNIATFSIVFCLWCVQNRLVVARNLIVRIADYLKLFYVSSLSLMTLSGTLAMTRVTVLLATCIGDVIVTTDH